MKSKIFELCGNKITWNDCIIAGVRVVKILKWHHLSEFEKAAVRKWAEDDSKRAIFINT